MSHELIDLTYYRVHRRSRDLALSDLGTALAEDLPQARFFSPHLPQLECHTPSLTGAWQVLSPSYEHLLRHELQPFTRLRDIVVYNSNYQLFARLFLAEVSPAELIKRIARWQLDQLGYGPYQAVLGNFNHWPALFTPDLGLVDLLQMQNYFGKSVNIKATLRELDELNLLLLEEFGLYFKDKKAVNFGIGLNRHHEPMAAVLDIGVDSFGHIEGHPTTKSLIAELALWSVSGGLFVPNPLWHEPAIRQRIADVHLQYTDTQSETEAVLTSGRYFDQNHEYIWYFCVLGNNSTNDFPRATRQRSDRQTAHQLAQINIPIHMSILNTLFANLQEAINPYALMDTLAAQYHPWYLHILKKSLEKLTSLPPNSHPREISFVVRRVKQSPSHPQN